MTGLSGKSENFCLLESYKQGLLGGEIVVHIAAQAAGLPGPLKWDIPHVAEDDIGGVPDRVAQPSCDHQPLLVDAAVRLPGAVAHLVIGAVHDLLAVGKQLLALLQGRLLNGGLHHRLTLGAARRGQNQRTC